MTKCTEGLVGGDAMLESVANLYTASDEVFPRPESFYNHGCCVKKADERPLLRLPREQLEEQTLAKPADHFCKCFATFEQASYFIPRLIELLADAEDGFQWGCLHISFFGFLLEHQREYESHGLWPLIEQCLADSLMLRTSTFKIVHYDKAACEAKQWQIDHFDYVVGSQGIDEMLDGFFYPVLTERPLENGRSEWDSLFERWEADERPERTAHLLNLLRQQGIEDYALPAGLLERISDQRWVDALIRRAEPAIVAANSPTWLADLRCMLSLE